jgi:hypothetical protein
MIWFLWDKDRNWRNVEANVFKPIRFPSAFKSPGGPASLNLYNFYCFSFTHIRVFLLCIEMKAFVYHVHTLSFPSGGVRSTGKIMDLGHHATCSGYSNLPSYVFFYAITYGFAFMDILITAAHQGISLSWLYLFFKNVFF